MSDEIANYDLKQVMKLEDCQELHSFLASSADRPVVIDCSSVTRLGGMTAQILQVAANAWAVKNLPFSLNNPSQDCIESLSTLGMQALLDEHGGSL